MLQSDSGKVSILELYGLCGVLFRGDGVCIWRRYVVVHYDLVRCICKVSMMVLRLLWVSL